MTGVLLSSPKQMPYKSFYDHILYLVRPPVCISIRPFVCEQLTSFISSLGPLAQFHQIWQTKVRSMKDCYNNGQGFFKCKGEWNKIKNTWEKKQ